MSDQNKVFAGWGSFETPEAPEGALTVIYGLSVDTVQVVGEATAANSEGLTPAALARAVAQKFNMPCEGLRVFVDGEELGFDTPIPAAARTLEFRQPSGEKGDGTGQPVMLPMGDTVTVTVVAHDVVTAIREEVEELGTMDRLLAGVVQFLVGVGIVRQTAKKAVIGRTHRVIVGKADVGRFIARIVRPAGNTVYHSTGEWGSCSSESVWLNNEPADPAAVTAAGDEVVVVIPGESREMSLGEWEAAQDVKAAPIFAARGEELSELPFAKLQTLAKAAGIKVSGLGRTRAAITADLLAAEREAWDITHGLTPPPDPLV